MEFILLNEVNLLPTPADLWIVSNIETSEKVQELDYYLNYQLTRSLHHKTTQPTDGLQKILELNEVAFEKLSMTHQTSPMLIATYQPLPLKKIVYLKETEKKQWIESAAHIWNNFKRPSLKLFLPKFVLISDLKTAWNTDLVSHPIYVFEDHV